MDWEEVIENLKYLISEDCTDTQFDYADEIEIAIKVMESQEDLRSKIDKAIREIKQEIQNGTIKINSGNEKLFTILKEI